MSDDVGNPALYPALILGIRRTKYCAQPLLVFQHALLEPVNVKGEEQQRRPGPEGHRQPDHEDEMAEIHWVAGIGIDSPVHHAHGGYVDARAAAADALAVIARQ